MSVLKNTLSTLYHAINVRFREEWWACSLSRPIIPPWTSHWWHDTRLLNPLLVRWSYHSLVISHQYLASLNTIHLDTIGANQHPPIRWQCGYKLSFIINELHLSAPICTAILPMLMSRTNTIGWDTILYLCHGDITGNILTWGYYCCMFYCVDANKAILHMHHTLVCENNYKAVVEASLLFASTAIWPFQSADSRPPVLELMSSQWMDPPHGRCPLCKPLIHTEPEAVYSTTMTTALHYYNYPDCGGFKVTA